MEKLKRRQIQCGIWHEIEPKLTQEDADAEGTTVQEAQDELSRLWDEYRKNEKKRVATERRTFFQGCGGGGSCGALRCCGDCLCRSASGVTP